MVSTPGLYIGGAIGVGDTSPSTMMDMCTLSTAPVTFGAKFDLNVGGAQGTSMHEAYIGLALMPTYAVFGNWNTERFAYGIREKRKAVPRP
ncbi:hypothetical protein BZG75_13770 [Salinivibrio sp. AR640]|nr:hypothetical protein BZG75_13770 [Salinivibrio sp. AR640]